MTMDMKLPAPPPVPTSSSGSSEEELVSFSSSAWIDAIVVVRFDVRDGQVVEELYPKKKKNCLSESSLKKICYLALPDSNSGHDGDVRFSFRIRQGSIPTHSMSPLEQSFLFATGFYRQIRDSSLPRGYFQKSVVIVSQHPYVSFLEDCVRVIGPLYFEFGANVLKAVFSDMRCWDAPIPGVSYELPLAGSTIYYRVPWTGLADDDLLKNKNKRILKLSSPESAIEGKISSTGQTGHGHVSPDTIASKVGTIDVDSDSDDDVDRSSKKKAASFQSDNNSSNRTPRNTIGVSLAHVFEAKVQENPGLFQNMSLFSTFGGLSVALWHIWELAIVGEPIIVLAPTPDRCSNAVLSIASLIAPLVYSGDYRPYFTIYDSDFREITRLHDQLRGQHMPPTIIGVTNPYFLKALEYWPNVISVGYMGTTGGSSSESSATVRQLGKVRRLSEEKPESLSVNGRNIGSAEYHPTIAKRSVSLRNLLSDQKYESSIILTRDEPLLPPDESVLRQLMVHKSTEETAAAAAAAVVAGEHWEAPAVAINNAVLRQHFRHLTEAFLRPLEKYFKLEAVGSRAARQNGIRFSAYNQPSSFAKHMHNFSIDAFMQSLETDLPPKILRNGNWRQLYRNFINGPNFWPWFSRKRMELNDKLSYIHRHLKLNTDSSALLKRAEKIQKRNGNTLGEKREASYVERSIPDTNASEGRRLLARSTNSHESLTELNLSCLPLSPSKTESRRPTNLDESLTVEVLLERVHQSLNKEYSKPVEDRDTELCEKMLEHMNALNAILSSGNN